MAKNDVPKFDDTEPIFEDTEPIDGESELKAPTKRIGTQEAFNKGVQQGGTLGLGDEFQGGVETIMDKLRSWGIDPTVSIFDGMKADGPSVSEINAKLAADGFKGDIGPKSSTDIYRQARDVARKDNDLAMEQHPLAFTAGGITGGLVTAPLMPGKLVAPLGQAAKGASILAKSGKAAVNAAPLAGIAGFGLAGGDIVESPEKVALDTGVNTAVGMLGAGALTGGIEVGKKVLSPVAKFAGKAIPKTVKKAFGYGVDGTDTTTPEWSNKVDNEVNSVVDETAQPLTTKAQAHTDAIDNLEKQIVKLQEEQKATISGSRKALTEENIAKQKSIQDNIDGLRGNLKELKSARRDAIRAAKAEQAAKYAAEDVESANNINQIDNEISELQARNQQEMDIAKSRQVATNKTEIDALNREAVQTAKEVEQYAGNVKKGIRKQFDAVDEAAEATGVTPRSDRVLTQFDLDLDSNMSLNPEAINRIKTNINTIYEKHPNNLAAYKAMKKELFALSGHQDPQVARAAKRAYANLKDDYATALTENNFGELAKKMQDTNNRWKTLLDLEDNFINRSLEYDPLTQSTSPKTIKTMESLAEKNKGQIGTSEAFQEKLALVDPDGSAAMLARLKELAQREQQAKAFKPNVSVDESEIVRLQKILAGLKEKRSAPRPPTPFEAPTSPEIMEVEKQIAQHRANLKATKEFSVEDLIPEVQDPKVAELEALLTQSRMKDPITGEIVPSGQLNSLSLPKGDQPIKDDLTKLLPKYGTESSNLVSKNKLDRIFEFLKKEKGEEFVSNIKNKLGPLSEDVALQSAQAGQGDSGVSMGAKGMVLKAFGGANKAANKAGLAVKKTSDVVDDAFNKSLFQSKPKTDTKEFLTKGVKHLSDSTPEGIQELSTRMAQTGEEGKGYANVLMESARKNRTSKNAIMFGLMQQPKFRELMQQLVNDDENNVKP